MGSSHSSHTNLRSQCTSYEAGATSTIARWGDSFEVSMGNTKENDHKEVWDVKYKTIQKQHTRGFNLKASRDNKGVESVHFGISDLANNKTEFTSKITRVSCDGLRGGITGIDSCNAPMSFTRSKKDYMVETTIVPYGCSYREGLFVLQMKKKVNSDNHAYIVNMAHYYVTKDVGLSVVAKIHHRKNGFAIEVEGPITHPSDELRKVIVKTRRTGMWSHSACSHCAELKANGGDSKSGGSNLSLVKAESSHEKSHGTIVQMVDHVFSSSVKEQYNKGFINSTGYTTGYMNNSIVFIDCNF